jgi:hypothetical protein
MWSPREQFVDSTLMIARADFDRPDSAFYKTATVWVQAMLSKPSSFSTRTLLMASDILQ